MAYVTAFDRTQTTFFTVTVDERIDGNHVVRLAVQYNKVYYLKKQGTCLHRFRCSFSGAKPAGRFQKTTANEA